MMINAQGMPQMMALSRDEIVDGVMVVKWIDPNQMLDCVAGCRVDCVP